MSRRAALTSISEVTAGQWGLISAAQARAIGVSRVDLNRLIADGALDRVDEAARVYRLAGAPSDPDLEGIRAAWVQLGGARMPHERGPDVVVSHRSAAAVYDFGDLIPRVHEFYVKHRRYPTRTDIRQHVRKNLSDECAAYYDGLWVSMPEHLIADLLADHEDESAVATIYRDARRRGLLNQTTLASLLEPVSKAPGSTYVINLLSSQNGVA